MEQGVTDTLMAVVTVRGRDDETRSPSLDREHLVNYSRSNVKDWLTRTLVWCLKNERTLDIRVASDRELETLREFRPSYRENRS